MKLPTIEIIFRQLASTLVARSERGIAVLILKDDTDESFSTRLYQSERELLADKAKYTPANYRQLADVMAFTPAKLYAVRVGTAESLTDALAIVAKTVKSAWVAYVGETADYEALTEWVKAQRLNGRTYKGIVFDVAVDCKYVVNFGNAKITFADTRGEQTGDQYLPSLLGILAKCNIQRGSTNFICENLTAALEPDDVEAALTAGKLMLVNEFDDVRVGLGINSMTTLAGGNTEDMKFIDIIETMDLIEDDIRNTFKEIYQGSYKNNLDNQMLFVSAVNTYLDTLARGEVLDIGYANRAEVDVETQRAAWAQIKPEAEYWDDATVRNTAYKRSVFLGGDIKINGVMENLKFVIAVF